MEFYFHHIHLICSDLDTTERFFTEMFGARFVTRATFGGVDGSKIELGDTRINLRLAKPSEKIDEREDHVRFGPHHIGIGVDDVGKAYDELLSKGVVFTVLPKQTPSGVVAFLKGPDGIVVELYQPEN